MFIDNVMYILFDFSIATTSLFSKASFSLVDIAELSVCRGGGKLFLFLLW